MLHSNRKKKTEPTFIMNKSILFAAVSSVLALTLTAADSGPREEIAKAAAKLANSASYSWHTTVKVPEDSQFKPGPTDGKIEKGGFTVVKMSFNNNERSEEHTSELQSR